LALAAGAFHRRDCRRRCRCSIAFGQATLLATQRIIGRKYVACHDKQVALFIPVRLGEKNLRFFLHFGHYLK